MRNDLVPVAGSMGDEIDVFEVNPLHVRGAQVEALDALITWKTAGGQSVGLKVTALAS